MTADQALATLHQPASAITRHAALWPACLCAVQPRCSGLCCMRCLYLPARWWGPAAGVHAQRSGPRPPAAARQGHLARLLACSERLTHSACLLRPQLLAGRAVGVHVLCAACGL